MKRVSDWRSEHRAVVRPTRRAGPEATRRTAGGSPLPGDLGIAFAPEWKLLEPQLRQLLAHTDSEALFFLIARGKHLFTHAPILIRVSFGEMIDRCAAENVLPAPLLEQLRSLASRFLPPEKAGALELKSVIYRFITSVVHGHPDLKPEALEALYKVRPDYLKAIAGYGPSVEQKIRGLWIGNRGPLAHMKSDRRWRA